MKSSMKSLAAIMAITALINEGTSKEMPSITKSVGNVLRAKGMKLFNIDGVEVWALNEKNARRKAKKRIG